MRLRFSEWTYINLTLATFVFAPEAHRLVNWHSNLDSLKLILALPTFMLVPIVTFVYPRRRELARSGFLLVAGVWSLGFVYALVVGTVFKQIAAGLYGIGLFVLPLVVGAWLVTRSEPVTLQYQRIARALTIYGTIAGGYGIFQYVVAPAWDTSWMQSIDADSFGSPEPFGIRVFSLMNGPGIYAEFTACALILTLPKLRISRPLSVICVLIMVTGLLLSLVRSAWLAVIIGALTLLIFSPKRAQVFTSILAVTALTLGFATAFFYFIPNDHVRLVLTNRINSLSNVSEDGSAIDRAQSSEAALASAVANPFGHGLGLTGQTSALASSSTFSDIPPGAIDNGFVSRFVEMGYPGLVLFLLAIVIALLISVKRLQADFRNKRFEEATITAAALSTQFALFLIASSGDVYAGIGALLMFIAFGLCVKPRQADLSMPVPTFAKRRESYRSGVAAAKF